MLLQQAQQKVVPLLLDAGGARLAGREKMIHALQSLKLQPGWWIRSSNPLQRLKLAAREAGLDCLQATLI
jgi:hypothetical protein